MKMSLKHFLVFFALILVLFWAGNYIWALVPFSSGVALVDSIISSLFVVGIFYYVWFKWGSEAAEEV